MCKRCMLSISTPMRNDLHKMYNYCIYVSHYVLETVCKNVSNDIQ